MVLVDGAGLPLAVDIDSASPAEVTLIDPLHDQAVTPYVPPRLIYDRAADSDHRHASEPQAESFAHLEHNTANMPESQSLRINAAITN